MKKKPAKRLLSATLAMLMLTPAVCVPQTLGVITASAAQSGATVTDSGSIGDAAYVLDSEGTLTITGDSVVIGAAAFAGKDLKTVNIGCTTVRIHPTAFTGNDGLTEINFTSREPVTVEGVIEGLTENTLVTIPLYSKKYTPAGKKFNYTEYSSENSAKRNDFQTRYDTAAYFWEDTSAILAEAEADEVITVSDVAEKTEEFTKSNWNTTFPNAKVQHFGTMAGFGTMADPYRIENTDNWRYLAYMTEKSLLSGSYYGQDRGTYVKLTADLTLSDKDGTFVPLGGRFTTEKSYVDRAYMGNFDGDGHTITLDVTNLDDPDGIVGFGLFAKTNCPYIKNLHISGQVISNEANTGLFIGHGSLDYLYNCSSDATLILQGSGEFKSSAFVGYSYRPTLENCHFTGSIIGDDPSIPAGEDDGTTITAVGGFVGQFSGSDGGESMKNCYFAPSEIKVGSTGSAMLYRPYYSSYSGFCGFKETENNYHNREAEKLNGADMGDLNQGESDSDGVDALNETEFWEDGQLTLPKATVQANPGTRSFAYTGGQHRLINDIQAVRSYSTGNGINEWDNFPYMPGYGYNGNVHYKVNDGEWSATPPTATEVGDYTVYYRATGDNYHRDSDVQSIEVSITDQQELPGSGTPADPYTISNDLEWSIFCDMHDTADKYFKLVDDIVVSETRESLRGPSHPNNFKGVFDGDGHTITLYWVNNNRYGYGTSLFGAIVGHSDYYESEQGGWHYWNATVKNLILDGIMINHDYTAPLAQSIDHATVSNIISNMTLVQIGYGGDRCGAGIVHTGNLGSVNGGSHYYNIKVGGIFDNNGTTTDRKWAGITNMNDFWKSGTDFIIKDCYVAPDCRNIKVSDGNCVILGNHVEGKSTIDNCFYGGNFLDIVPVDEETGETTNTQGISDENGLDALYATGYWADGNPTMPKATITTDIPQNRTIVYIEPETDPETGEPIEEEPTVYQLIDEPETEDGTIWYRVNGGEWQTDVPTATEPGKYRIEYKAVGDYLHRDSDTAVSTAYVVYDWATPTGLTATLSNLPNNDYGSLVSGENAKLIVNWDDDERLDGCAVTAEVITPDGKRGKIIDSAPVAREFWYELSDERPTAQFYVGLLGKDDSQVFENGSVNGAKYGDTIIVTAVGLVNINGDVIGSAPCEGVDLALAKSNTGKTFPVIPGEMSNDSALKDDIIVKGDKIIIECIASGGKAPYKFEVSYKKSSSSSYTTAQSYNKKQIVSITPGTATVYNIRVNAKDSSGNAVGKEFSVKVNKALVNLSAISGQEVVSGDTVTVNAAAEGGLGEYRYSLKYKKPGSDEWINAVPEYGTDCTAKIITDTAGTYEIETGIKDTRGVEAVKSFSVKVNKILADLSSVSADEIVVGDSITINAAAEGGIAPYQYEMSYTREGSDEVDIIRAYSTDASAVFTPDAAGNYTVKVNTRDKRGVVESSSFSIKVNELLANTSAVSADEIVIGESIEVTASATGGLGTYQYEVTYFAEGSDEIKTAQSYSSGTKVSISPEATGKYTVRASVKDQRGMTEIKSFDLQVYPVLKNESTVSAEKINLGKSVTLTAKASGGTGKYTYALLYRKSGSTSWTAIGTKYSKQAEGSFTPGKAVPYEATINVKDSMGKVRSKTFTIEVFPVLKNESTVSAEAVTVGDKVTLKAAAADGTGGYTYALLYKKSSAKSWSTIGTKYGTQSEGSFKPGSAVPYDVMINVKDSSGVVKSKSFKISVYPVLVNESTVSHEKITLGQYITLNGKASGGTGEYSYSLMYKKSASAKWTVLGTEYGKRSEASFKPGSAVPYDIRISIRDSMGITVTRDFTVNVYPTLKIRSSIMIDDDTVSVNAAAEGGTGGYTYAIKYKISGSREWTLIGTEQSASFTPESGNTYDILTTVQDSSGNIRSKRTVISFIEELQNRSALSSESVVLGESVTVNTDAIGGTGSYNYTLMYKAEEDAYFTVQTAGNDSVLTFTPQKAGSFDVRIIVTDETGDTSAVDYTLIVK